MFCHIAYSKLNCFRLLPELSSFFSLPQRVFKEIFESVFVQVSLISAKELRNSATVRVLFIFLTIVLLIELFGRKAS